MHLEYELYHSNVDEGNATGLVDGNVTEKA
jgi:hypothetical protein